MRALAATLLLLAAAARGEEEFASSFGPGTLHLGMSAGRGHGFDLMNIQDEVRMVRLIRGRRVTLEF